MPCVEFGKPCVEIGCPFVVIFRLYVDLKFERYLLNLILIISMINSAIFKILISYPRLKNVFSPNPRNQNPRFINCHVLQ